MFLVEYHFFLKASFLKWGDFGTFWGDFGSQTKWYKHEFLKNSRGEILYVVQGVIGAPKLRL